ncbi:hypothetical protein C4571_01810 [Candidatus Parcubacteria bacterium]|nr:MAG: hypothetical protein C4571_01810 [Candidatus Parcubacteria bacterium]
MPRRLKQVVYGFFYLIFFALLGTGIYFLFLKPEVSCFDKRQNQNEEGIDCGRVCGNICLPATLKSLALLDQPSVLPIDETHSSILITMQNPNADYGARSFGYEVVVYDRSGASLQSLENRSFIYPGEIKRILLPNLAFGKSSLGRVEVTFENPDWAKGEDFKRPSLLLQDQKTRIEGSNVVIEGKVTNQDTLPLRRVGVVGVFEGKLGQTVGASLTEIESIFPNETRSFTLVHPLRNEVSTAVPRVFLYAFRP